MDLLALQLIQVMQFISMDFNTEAIFTDHILSENAKGGDLFYKFNRRWFMRNESIPGETSLKAIAFDKKAVYLETGTIDYGRAWEIIADHNLDCKIDQTGRRLLSNTRGKILMEYSLPYENLKAGDEALEPRIKIRLPFSSGKLSGLKIVDKLWSYDAFQTFREDNGDLGTAYGERTIKMQLNMSLQQRLQLEQRPMLLMETSQRAELNQSLQGVLAIQTHILGLQGYELEAYVANYAFENGERVTQKILDFVLAGKVKRVKPSLNWIQARSIAKKLAANVTV